MHTQFVVLAVASGFQEKELLTQARLSQLTGSDAMTISQVVRALEKSGYIQRVSHPDDTRSKVIVVSEAGKALAKRAVQIVEKTDKAFLWRLPGTERTSAWCLLARRDLQPEKQAAA